MKSIQSIAAVLFTTVLSMGMVLGAFQMSFVEGDARVGEAINSTPTPSITSHDLDVDLASDSRINQTTPLIQVITQTPIPTQVNTLAVCPPPENWKPYSIQVGDSLQRLAELFLIPIEEIKLANCLEIDSLIPGSFIYLPQVTSTPTLTITPTNESTQQCGPPSNWVVYIIQSDDTLFELSILFGVSVPELQIANCMGDSTLLKTGTRFFVPFYLPTSIAITATPTNIITPLMATLTPTKTIVISLSPTNTATFIYTSTVVVTATPGSSTSTSTPVPTNTSTASAPTATTIPPTSGPSNTPDPLNTPTLSPTPPK